MVQGKREHQIKKKKRFRVNREIGHSNIRVLLIDENNVNCGFVPLRTAIDRAESLGLDLVQMSDGSHDKGPTCKILDFSKFKYDLSKKERLAKKKQRLSVSKVKEIKFRPSTDINDLTTKAKQASAFVDDGHKVKITIVFKRHEFMQRENAKNLISKFVDIAGNIKLISVPSMTGRNLSVMADKAQEEKHD